MMTRFTSAAARLVMVIALAWAAPAVLAVDVKVNHDKGFDFSTAQTWAWSAQRGDVKMARTQEDDPEAMRKIAEPVIMSAVANEMTRRGLKQAPDAPLVVTYYLLLSIDQSAQTLGQFLPAVTQWGVPPYAPATQSLEMMNHGSLVLDMTAKGVIVWRGVADAKIKRETENLKQREDLIREAVRDLLKGFPPKR
jgi:Domain of unknown function (DUF4136)